MRLKTGDDLRAELIRKYAAGRSFVDIGCMWKVNGFFSFLAEECKAERVVAVDLYQSDEFMNEKKKRNSKVEFVQGDINLPETIDKIGEYDVVFCSGVIYHSPNPAHTLSQIRKITKEILILGTMVIPEMAGIKNTAVFYPFLDVRQRKIWDLGISQWAITEPYNQENNYANWFWGFSPSCIESMLKWASFEVWERHIIPFQAFFVCRVT